MRISDWSSDVCSSDLYVLPNGDYRACSRCRTLGSSPWCNPFRSCRSTDAGRSAADRTTSESSDCREARQTILLGVRLIRWPSPSSFSAMRHQSAKELGRASCRERQWQLVYISEVAVSVKKQIDASLITH